MIKLRAEFPEWVNYDHSDPVGLAKKLPPITNKITIYQELKKTLNDALAYEKGEEVNLRTTTKK